MDFAISKEQQNLQRRCRELAAEFATRMFSQSQLKIVGVVGVVGVVGTAQDVSEGHSERESNGLP